MLEQVRQERAPTRQRRDHVAPLVLIGRATFILASEPLSDRIDPFLFTALAMTGAAWATGLLTAARGGVSVDSLARAGAPLLGLALLSTVVPAVAFLVGMRRVGAPTAAILSCLEVVVTCVVAWVALGDHLTPVQLAGCAAVVVAVVVLKRRPGNFPRLVDDKPS